MFTIGPIFFFGSIENTIAVTRAVAADTKNTFMMVSVGMLASFMALIHTTKNTAESIIIKNKRNFFKKSFMPHLLSHTEFALKKRNVSAGDHNAFSVFKLCFETTVEFRN